MKTSKRLPRPVTILTLVVSLAALAVGSGCVAVVAGAGAGAAVAYVRGDLTGTLEAGLDKTVRAADSAISQLRFAKISEKQDAMLAVIVARNAADKKIEIRLEKQGEALTKIKIRVGMFGNESLSLTILDKVKSNL